MLGAAQLFRSFAAVLLLLLAIAVLKERQRGPIPPVMLAFLVTLSCYLSFPDLTGWPGTPLPLWAHLMFAGRNATPFTFWLLSKVCFDDGFRPRPAHALILLVQTGLQHLGFLVLVEGVPFGVSSRAGERAWAVIPDAVSLLLILHALSGIYVGSRTDLVEARLRLRRLVLAVTGGYAVLVLLGEIFLHGAKDVRVPELLNAIAIFLLVLTLSALLLRLEPEFLRGSRPPVQPPALDAELHEKLLNLLETDQVFREEGLTIGALATRLGEQEYKVRQLINGQLGFRNFNAFLHGYRIREAQRMLSDPRQKHLSVADIAYALGYQSLGPFNKAFKELSELTPTEFRRRELD